MHIVTFPIKNAIPDRKTKTRGFARVFACRIGEQPIRRQQSQPNRSKGALVGYPIIATLSIPKNNTEQFGGVLRQQSIQQTRGANTNE